MNITIIGTGYVGLVTGVCFADKGHSVFCIDNNEEKIATLWQGKSPIYEPGLDELLKDTIEQGTINFSSDLQKGVRHAEVIFYCLPTPQGEDGQADLRSVITVSNQIGEYFNGHKIIVNKSTVPVGTSKQVYQALSQNAADTFDVVSNPEFLREGTAIGD